MQIDARGFGCPKPVMMAEKALSQIDEGTIEVLVDNEASVKNLSRFATKQGMYVETGKEDTYWTVKIVKGYPCEIESASGGQPLKYERREKDIFMIIGTDILGKEEELGKILMKGFIETMKVTKELPHTIFFLNAGVKLTTVNEEIVSILKEIEDIGVEIFSCGTCLKYYNLEDELKVGYRGTTNHIVEGIKDFKKVVWV
jgi:selenium metabolism protein YedF